MAYCILLLIRPELLNNIFPLSSVSPNESETRKSWSFFVQWLTKYWSLKTWQCGRVIYAWMYVEYFSIETENVGKRHMPECLVASFKGGRRIKIHNVILDMLNGSNGQPKVHMYLRDRCREHLSLCAPNLKVCQLFPKTNRVRISVMTTKKQFSNHRDDTLCCTLKKMLPPP